MPSEATPLPRTDAAREPADRPDGTDLRDPADGEAGHGDDLRVGPLTLRRATPDDAAEIQALLATDPGTWALLEGGPLRDDEALHLLAERPPGVPPERKRVHVADGVCVLDLVEGFPDPRTWYLGLIFLAPARRGGGLGTRLLDALCGQARARGAAALRLAVVGENVAARRLYDRLGFAHVARRTRPTAGGGSHEVDVLELDLTRAPARG